MVVTANTFSSTTTTTTDESLKGDVPTGNFLSYVGSLWYKGNFPYPERTIEEQAKIRTTIFLFMSTILLSKLVVSV